MIQIVRDIAVPKLQSIGVYGACCFDYKDGDLLELNARHGALDFVDGMVKRIGVIHYPDQPYAYYHSHEPLEHPTDFDRVWEAFETELSPQANGDSFMVVTNPEALPYGGSLDLTAVNFGLGCSVERARAHYQQSREQLLKKL
jgi:hypothetical protein